MQGCCEQTALKQAEFDGLVNAWQCEVERFEDNLRRLVNTLEPPRPADTCGDEGKQAMPRTVQEALQRIYSRMVNSNEYLHSIINRLQEQVGELKILP